MIKNPLKRAVSLLLIMLVSSVFMIRGLELEIFLGLGAPSYNEMDILLNENIEELSYVANELFKQDCFSVTIRSQVINDTNTYKMKVEREYLVYETVSIPENLIFYIDVLFENGVQVITRSRDSVDFSVWSSMDESRGIIYSRKGEILNSEQLIKVNQLSKKNWYYYIHNYEKAKEKKPERFE